MAEAIVGNVRPQLLVLLGSVGTRAADRCVNVANLFLAAATARTREVSGAYRARRRPKSASRDSS